MTRGIAWLGCAALLGVLHSFFTFYWLFGGEWLLATLGDRVVDAFADAPVVLLAAGVVKVVAAIAPLLFAYWGWLRRRPVKALCWVGAAVLIVWGGANTVVGNLVLSGIIQPAGGYDRPGMVGHAWLWDPLFLLWGAALVAGLVLHNRRGSLPHDP
ncbi:uncharacterized protein DUF3995 [Tamaricihabitans halophyticus]|uniref:Uncharacterized protein DUF3995 n=1 Tax=Tamaricihabitans halophyticus TaxID=1262583 RepID=A0A4R2R2N0_9PSEU|nr:DUF3995 domain-containing protein [Tamaricihabitans halophyticus]TCP56267.1 uncharacterized protein DUF3995 [Tamaricihabitans halophyticus]